MVVFFDFNYILFSTPSLHSTLRNEYNILLHNSSPLNLVYYSRNSIQKFKVVCYLRLLMPAAINMGHCSSKMTS